MSNERVRINLTFKPEDVDLIDHYAGLLGISRATYCSMLIKQGLGTVSPNYGSVKVVDPETGNDMLVWKGFRNE